MGWSLLPREEKFFVLFNKIAAKVVEGAHKFRDLLESYTDVEEKAKRIKELEHETDVLVHEVMDKLNKSFITPLEREDIRALAMYLDDVIDDIEATASKLATYEVKKPTSEAAELARIICRATEEIEKAVQHL